jgi:FkbM family methyltransferase|tara:strand:+ start:136 stop:975 length:840 start_codon:yes stop_codon:yes gene_type:complete
MLSTKIKILIARIAQRFVCIFYSNTKNICVQRKGIRWNLDLNEGIDFSIFMFGYFERETVNALDRLINKGDTIIDIGANIGAHTLHMAQKTNDSGKVYAIEPTDYAFSKLTENTDNNPSLNKQISLRQVLLVEDDNNITEEIYSSWPLNDVQDRHEVHCGVKKTISGAKKQRLDDFISSEKIDQVDLIKLDVDGNELQVIGGGKGLIKKFSPTFVMEFGPDQYEINEDFDEAVNLLLAMNYKFFSLNEKIQYPSDISLLRDIIPKNGSINIVAKKDFIK